MTVDSNSEWEYYNPMAYEEFENMDYERLIGNAWKAFHNSKTEWAKNYWTAVVRALLRRVDVH